MTKLLGKMMLVSVFLSTLQSPVFASPSDLAFINQVLQKSKVLKRSGARTTGSIALVIENTAEQLEDAEIHSYDSKVAEWTMQVANRLRNVAFMFRSIGMSAAAFDSQLAAIQLYFF